MVIIEFSVVLLHLPFLVLLYIDTPIAVILVVVFGGAISFFTSSVVKLAIVLAWLVNEVDSVKCA